MYNLSRRYVTHRKILSRKSFGIGFRDARKGKPFDPDLFSDQPGDQWNYERGRQLACVYDGPLKENRRVTNAAVKAAIFDCQFC